MTISRVTRSYEDARTGYDRLSRWYDVLAGSAEKKYRERGLEKLSARSGERILEIGFGTGHCLVALARAVGTSGHVIGLDISAGMLAVSQKRLVKEGLSQRVNLRLGNAADMSFLDPESLDGIFISFTLELFDTPDIPRVIQECGHLLKRGGRIAVVSMTKTNPPGVMVRIYEWFHAHLPVYADCRPIFPRQALEENGFAIRESSQMSMWGLPVEIVLAEKK